MIDLSDTILRKVQLAIADLKKLNSEEPDKIAIKSGIRLGGLPLLSTLGGTVMLFSNGEILQLGLDDDGPFVPLDSKNEIMALVAGSEQYPWLATLLPIRSGSAVTCPECHGHRKFFQRKSITDSAIYCPNCSGLGWVDAD